MKTLGKGKYLVLMIAILLATACNQGNADEVQTNQKNTEFKSAQYLYEKCKEAVGDEDFSNSPCALYIEAFVGGAGIALITTLGQADNQAEILDRYNKSKCRELDLDAPKDSTVKSLAEYFIDWIERNQNVVQVLEKESGFMTKEAYGVLHLITTDERFCTRSPISLPSK